MMSTRPDPMRRTPGSWWQLLQGIPVYTNPRTGVTLNESQLSEVEQLVSNAIYSIRRDMARGAGNPDPRRDVWDECGYPSWGQVSPEIYQRQFDRNPIAARVVEVYPKECFQVNPTVRDSAERPEQTDPTQLKAGPTAFEQGLDSLASQLAGEMAYHKQEEGNPLWEYMRRADELSGIGSFGVMLIAIDDELDLRTPAQFVYPRKPDAVAAGGTTDQYFREGASASATVGGTTSTELNLPVPVTPSVEEQTEGEETLYILPPEPATAPTKPTTTRKLLFLRVFPESLVDITQFESSPKSPRFGQPVMYRITLHDPKEGQQSGIGLSHATVEVHWTRVVHFADNWHQASSSEIFARSRMTAVLNRLLDLDKLYGGSAEMYWQGALPGTDYTTHPELGGDVVVDREAMKDELEKRYNGLQRFSILSGMTPVSTAPQVVDPTPQIDKQIEAICIKGGYPIRIFKGSERGELASSQDDNSWNDKVKQRENGYLTPRVVAPVINRLICLGVLPPPDGGSYYVEWPDITSTSAGERASVANQRTTAMGAYIASGIESLMTPFDFLVLELGYSEEVARGILERAMQAGTPPSDEPTPAVPVTPPTEEPPTSPKTGA